MKNAHLYLASASPRRRALLSQLGLSFDVHPVDADESVHPDEKAADYVARLARDKASIALQGLLKDQAGACYVIGSDTSVVIGDKILGKPVDEADFRLMMQALSGQEHEVLTGVAVLFHDGEGERKEELRVVATKVRFRPLSDADIEAYWQSGEPADKAGGYGIQGLGALFVDSIQGCYNNVVGLPLGEVAEMLSQLDFDVWEQRQEGSL